MAKEIHNISGKYHTTDIKEDDLFKFVDEIEIVDPEERRLQALAGAEYHMKMFPGLIKKGKDGKAKIYGGDN